MPGATGTAVEPEKNDGDPGEENPQPGTQTGDPAAPANGEHGFPENTPIKDMTAEQEAAYHKFHKRKAENKVEELTSQIAALTAAATADSTDAYSRGQAAGLAAGLAVAAESELARMSGLSADDVSGLVKHLSMDSFVRDGKLDTEALSEVAKKFAKPASYLGPHIRSASDLNGGLQSGASTNSVADSRAAELARIESQRKGK